MADHPRPLGGALLVLGGAVLWGTTGTAQALGPAAASPLAVGATRLVAGGALLVLWAAVRRWRMAPASSTRVSVAAVRDSRGPGGRLPRRGGIAAGVVGALGVAAYQVSFFAAVDAAGVALGTAVAIGSAPVMTGLIEWGNGGDRPGARWWLATAVAGGGVMMLAGPSALAPTGVVLALAAGASYAVYAVASKRLLDDGLDSPTAMAVVFGGGGLLVLPVLAVVELSWVATAAGAGVLAWLSVATILLAYVLFGAGLREVPASTAATLSLAEPLTAAVLGIAVLGERPSAAGVVGAGVILLGLVVLLARSRSVAPFA